MRRRNRRCAGPACHVCGRALKDAESIKRGMGPVCAKRAEQALRWNVAAEQPAQS